MLKVKHLRHPVRTATSVRHLAMDRLVMRRLAHEGKQHYKGDRRYDLQCVSDGFAKRPADEADDRSLLERISAAYRKAVEREPFAPACYKATDWWELVRRSSLGPVRQALQYADIPSLDSIYRRFYRDPCSAGLIAAPYGMSNAFFDRQIRDLLRHYYLSDTLHRLDYWAELVGEGYKLSDLAGPGIGEPFGAVVDRVLIRKGADYQHYCAHRVRELMGSNAEVVLEVGGGFGGIAYYLLRDRPGLTYINVDVPESLALASYFLIKSFPNLKFLLYGEEELTQAAIESADAILMPLWELKRIPTATVNVSFSSHAMSDLTSEAMKDYSVQIGRVTCGSFLHWGNASSFEAISDSINRWGGVLGSTATRLLRWHRHRVHDGDDIECSFHVRTSDAAEREGRSSLFAHSTE